MKKRTYKQAQTEILNELFRQDWAVRRNLKTPYATSPGGYWRLWFKSQAIHYQICLGHSKFNFSEARSIDPGGDHDIRQEAPTETIAWIIAHLQHWTRKQSEEKVLDG